MSPAHPRVTSRLAFACLMLAACALIPRTSHAQEELLGELNTVAEVQIEGNRHLGDGEIRSVLKT
ncbi:MAG TPA: hypothetical protein VEY91_03995, partial [Candidatus Limnocylindria bacterium]|nr:hypothetical protein [Candidatus Limnocylindria bacterium]